MSKVEEIADQLEAAFTDGLPGVSNQIKMQNQDQQEEELINVKSVEEPTQTQPQPVAEPQEPQKVEQKPKQDDVIDPFHELIKNSNVVPLLAVLKKLDLNTIVEGKPLLSRLCTMQLPLNEILADRQIVFTNDDDNRTALHEAIVADDVKAVCWCMKNKIGNVRDNFGNTPILEAIKYGRRACFLLCLQYNYYDNLAPTVCGIYNRAWQIKVLHKLGQNVLYQLDNQNMTPYKRAVQNYSYDVADYLTFISEGSVPIEQLARHTDSKGMVRLIQRVKKQNSFLWGVGITLIQPLIHLFIIYMASSLPVFMSYQIYIKQAILIILTLYVCLYSFSWIFSQSPNKNQPNFDALLKAPQFPVPLNDICPHCLVVQDPQKEHCRKCNACVTKLHNHDVVCVNKSNQIFSFLLQVTWFWLVYNMHDILMSTLQVGSLSSIAFSGNIFFRNASIIESLYQSQHFILLGLFLYLKFFTIYQFCCLFQWVYMMILNRTYREVNNSERYIRLYQIGQTPDGNYKTLQIRLMERGFVGALAYGLKNAFSYFFN